MVGTYCIQPPPVTTHQHTAWARVAPPQSLSVRRGRHAIHDPPGSHVHDGSEHGSGGEALRPLLHRSQVDPTLHFQCIAPPEGDLDGLRAALALQLGLRAEEGAPEELPWGEVRQLCVRHVPTLETRLLVHAPHDVLRAAHVDGHVEPVLLPPPVQLLPVRGGKPLEPRPELLLREGGAIRELPQEPPVTRAERVHHRPPGAEHHCPVGRDAGACCDQLLD